LTPLVVLLFCHSTVCTSFVAFIFLHAMMGQDTRD
jgi:hypothetical protein